MATWRPQRAIPAASPAHFLRGRRRADRSRFTMGRLVALLPHELDDLRASQEMGPCRTTDVRRWRTGSAIRAPGGRADVARARPTSLSGHTDSDSVPSHVGTGPARFRLPGTRE